MSRIGILGQISVERDRQIAKWGEQRVPSVEAHLLSDYYDGSSPFTSFYGLPSEADAKEACDEAHRLGVLSSAHIAVEELCEAISCGSDEVAMRAELVQTAAVIVHWIECIDHRKMLADLDA